MGFTTTTIDLSGQVFGRLTVLRRDGITRGCQARWLCQCECGNQHSAPGYSLRQGFVKSCHCQWRRYGHGHTRGRKMTPTYNSWRAMIERCENPNAISFKNYCGSRGITVCAEWHSFDRFLADMGERPVGDMSLDRINNDGNYEPGNCHWATRKEQNDNRWCGPGRPKILQEGRLATEVHIGGEA
jgi:hypothetical protein